MIRRSVDRPSRGLFLVLVALALAGCVNDAMRSHLAELDRAWGLYSSTAAPASGVDAAAHAELRAAMSRAIVAARAAAEAE